MTTLDTATLTAIAGHANTFNLQATIDGVVQDLTAKTMTAKVKYSGAGSPLSLSSPASGLAFTDAVIGKIALSLSMAQVDAMPLDGTASVYLTVWNADNSIWAHGTFPLLVALG